jgi:hypothetical protein
MLPIGICSRIRCSQSNEEATGEIVIRSVNRGSFPGEVQNWPERWQCLTLKSP